MAELPSDASGRIDGPQLPSDASGRIDGPQLPSDASGRIDGPQLSSLAEFVLDPGSVQLLGYGFARRKQVVILGAVDPEGDDPVSVGMVDPTDASLIRHLGDFLGRPVMPVRLSSYDIGKALDQGYGRWHETEHASTLTWSPPEGVDADPDQPLQRVLDGLLTTAIGVGATAIHIETSSTRVRARLRVDGALRTIPVALQPDTVGAFETYVYALAGIGRHRGPSSAELPVSRPDGEASRPVGAVVDASVGAGVHDLLIRLRPSAAALGLDALGLDDAQYGAVRSMLEDPHGLVVFAGPRGSGCTTTLRAALQIVGADETTRVVAVDRWADTAVEGVVHHHASDDQEIATFLWAVARRGADVLAVDGLPDAATARMAVQAAQAGHLMLAVLGASEPGAAIARLRAFGLDDALLADALLGVVAQRLVRRICPHCTQPAPPTPLEEAVFARLGRRFAHHHGVGCSHCAHTGFKGRLALFEVLAVDPEVAHLIATSAPTHQLRTVARSRGMTTMFDAGVRHVEAGQTTLEEVRRAVPARLLAED